MSRRQLNGWKTRDQRVLRKANITATLIAESRDEMDLLPTYTPSRTAGVRIAPQPVARPTPGVLTSSLPSQYNACSYSSVSTGESAPPTLTFNTLSATMGLSPSAREVPLESLVAASTAAGVRGPRMGEASTRGFDVVPRPHVVALHSDEPAAPPTRNEPEPTVPRPSMWHWRAGGGESSSPPPANTLSPSRPPEARPESSAQGARLPSDQTSGLAPPPPDPFSSPPTPALEATLPVSEDEMDDWEHVAADSDEDEMEYGVMVSGMDDIDGPLFDPSSEDEAESTKNVFPHTSGAAKKKRKPKSNWSAASTLHI